MYQKYYGTKLVDAKPANNAGSGELGYWIKYENGYESWSPKEVFEKAYQPLTAMSFGHAIKAIEAGETVTRKDWTGTTKLILLGPGSTIQQTVDGVITKWQASETDILANDWLVIAY